MSTKLDAVRNRIYWALRENLTKGLRLISEEERIEISRIAAQAVVETDDMLTLVAATLPYNLARQVGMESNEDRRRERAVEDSIRDAELVLRKVAELPPTKA